MGANADFDALRQQMIEAIHRAGAFQTPGVETAFRVVPRHLFLSHLPPEEAYANQAVGLKHEGGLLVSSASQPSMMAAMLDQAQLQRGENVLEIGTASGYNAAIMRHLVGDGGSVTSVEFDDDLVDLAQTNLARADISGVEVVHGDGAAGYVPNAPYDAIVATVGVWDVPRAWVEQLKPDGRLIVPLFIDGVQMCASFRKEDADSIHSTDNRPCAFVYLRGAFAGPAIRSHVGSTSLYLIADQVESLDMASLHLLLSDDHDLCYLESPLDQPQFWYGFQLYAMLNEPENFLFSLFAVIEGQQAYGIEGRGLTLFGNASAVFVPYNGGGEAHCFAGADAFLAMQTLLDEWNHCQRPTTKDLHLRLVPRTQDPPHTPRKGKVYERHDHYLHGWLDA